MDNMVTLELTTDMLETIIDCVNDRLETVEDLIGFEESNGNEVDADTLRGVSMELHEVLGVLGR